MPRSYCNSLIKSVCCVIDNKRTVSTDSIIRVMASGERRPGADRSGINFQVSVHIPWNAPKLFVAFVQSLVWSSSVSIRLPPVPGRPLTA